MASLQRTLAFAKRDEIAKPVAEQLHFDVPGLFDVFFQVHTRIAERLRGAIRTALQRTIERSLVFDDLHANSAAASNRFNRNRKPDSLRFLARLIRRLHRDRRIRARHRRNPYRKRHGARTHLVAQRIERIGRGPTNTIPAS